MDVLEDTYSVVGRRDAEVLGVLGVPHLGEVFGFDLGGDEEDLDLEADEDVEVVGQLVGPTRMKLG